MIRMWKILELVYELLSYGAIKKNVAMVYLRLKSRDALPFVFRLDDVVERDFEHLFLLFFAALTLINYVWK